MSLSVRLHISSRLHSMAPMIHHHYASCSLQSSRLSLLANQAFNRLLSKSFNRWPSQSRRKPPKQLRSMRRCSNITSVPFVWLHFRLLADYWVTANQLRVANPHASNVRKYLNPRINCTSTFLKNALWLRAKELITPHRKVRSWGSYHRALP